MKSASIPESSKPFWSWSCRSKPHSPCHAGWGNWVNTAVIALLLAMFGQFGPDYSPGELETVWRLSFILGLAPIAGVRCTIQALVELFFHV